MVGKEEERMKRKLGRMAWWKLPYELIREIFSWLPGDSLMRFKLVSKQLLHLITNPDQDFLNSHLNRSFLAKPGLLVLRKTNQQTQFEYAQDYTSPNNLTRFKIPFTPSIPNEYRVVNICNGLVCFTDFIPNHHSNVYVWNPFTGDHITLPPSPVPSYLIPGDREGNRHFRRIDILYAFGFDPATDVYKVIKIVSAPPVNEEGDCDSHVTVFTLGKDSSWKTLPKTPYYFSFENVSTPPLNGVLYWFVPMLNRSVGWYRPRRFLVSFDIRNETFQEIQQPDGLFSKSVGVLDGLLCIFCSVQDWDYLEVEIWVRGENGVADSWRKHCIIEEPEVCGRFLRLLGDADSREIILWTFNQELFSYDPKTSSFRKLHMFGSDVLETHVFRGSLLSPTIINGASRPAT